MAIRGYSLVEPIDPIVRNSCIARTCRRGENRNVRFSEWSGSRHEMGNSHAGSVTFTAWSSGNLRPAVGAWSSSILPPTQLAPLA
jgi:hypothetical protein